MCEEDIFYIKKLLRSDGKINNRLILDTHESIIYLKSKYENHIKIYKISGVINVILHNNGNFLCSCGNVLEKIHYDKRFLCLKCRYSIRQSTAEKNSMDKYGVPHAITRKDVVEKIKLTNLSKYGSENPMKNIEMKMKYKQKMTEQFGVDNIFQLEKTKSKIKDTNLSKYGAEHYGKSKEFKDLKFKGIARIFVDNVAEIYNNYIKDNNNNFILKEFSEYLSIDPMTVSKYLNSVGIYPSYGSGISTEEKELLEFLKYLEQNVSTNRRDLISPFEIDIYLSNLSLCVEYNGVYWHSLKHKNYHLNKTEMCEKIGLELIHVNSDEWINKKDLVKNLFFYKFKNEKLKKISVFKTHIKHVDANDQMVFLNGNDFSGYVASDYCYGAYENDELIAVVGVSHTADGSFEIKNICVKSGVYIENNLCAIYDHFIQKHNPSEIILYHNRKYGRPLFILDGMKLIQNTEPKFQYVKNGVVVTTTPIVEDHNYTKIYDCGNSIYVWHKKLNTSE